MPFLLLFALLFVVFTPANGDAQVVGPERIAVTATPIPLNPQNASQTVVGRLRYMGGLRLTSTDRRFGGLSGLRWHDGTLYAISDQGDFFTFAVDERHGRLTGVHGARVRRLTRTDGAPLGGKAESDAEALEVHVGRCGRGRGCPPDSAFVSFEGTNRILAYRLVNGLPQGAATEHLQSAEWRRGLPSNGGVE